MTYSAAEGKYIYQGKVAQAPEGGKVKVESNLGGTATESVTVK